MGLLVEAPLLLRSARSEWLHPVARQRLDRNDESTGAIANATNDRVSGCERAAHR